MISGLLDVYQTYIAMKNLIKTALFLGAISLSVTSFAQKKDTIKVNPDPAIKKTAKTIGNKTAETAAKGAAKVTDKTYASKVGPQGQTIYIDKNSKYYYINSKGNKIYVSKGLLKNKPAK